MLISKNWPIKILKITTIVLILVGLLYIIGQFIIGLIVIRSADYLGGGIIDIPKKGDVCEYTNKDYGFSFNINCIYQEGQNELGSRDIKKTFVIKDAPVVNFPNCFGRDIRYCLDLNIYKIKKSYSEAKDSDYIRIFEIRPPTCYKNPKINQVFNCLDDYYYKDGKFYEKYVETSYVDSSQGRSEKIFENQISEASNIVNKYGVKFYNLNGTKHIDQGQYLSTTGYCAMKDYYFICFSYLGDILDNKDLKEILESFKFN